jgi:ribosomal protein S8
LQLGSFFRLMKGFVNGYQILSPFLYPTDGWTRLLREDIQPRPALMLRLTLKYVDGKVPVVSGLKRISKPGLRVYARKTDIPRVLGGLGIVIVSTSQGIMTGQQARKAELGGEVLAYVW